MFYRLFVMESKMMTVTKVKRGLREEVGTEERGRG